MTYVIGLTGSIATGKSTAARMLMHLGLPVFDADKAAHRLLSPSAKENCFEAVAALFPEAITDAGIDRKKLGEVVFSDKEAKQKLEAILHPEVRKAEITFIKAAQRQRRRAVVLDIPLLFETGADMLCDSVWLVHCPAFLQKQRALRRINMTEKKFEAILASQWPQAEKKRCADVQIDSALGKALMMQQIKRQLGLEVYA